MYVHVLMRDEEEGRKKQARSNKQHGKATQHTQGSHGSSKQTITQLCLVVCITLFASFFLSSTSALITMYMYMYMYMYMLGHKSEC